MPMLNTRRSSVKSIKESSVLEIEHSSKRTFRVSNIRRTTFSPPSSIRSSWVYLLSIAILSDTLASPWAK